MKVNLMPPTIPEYEKSPLVSYLATFIEHQGNIIEQQADQIQQLKDEIARLKNQPPRPKIAPSTLEKKKKGKSKASKGKRPVSKKRRKTAQLTIHQDDPVEAENILYGSEFRYHKPFVVQNLKIEAHNIRYRLKVYQTPDGGYVSWKKPAYLNDRHYGPSLIRFVLYQ
jgi:hypothetical protein